MREKSQELDNPGSGIFLLPWCATAGQTKASKAPFQKSELSCASQLETDGMSARRCCGKAKAGKVLLACRLSAAKSPRSRPRLFFEQLNPASTTRSQWWNPTTALSLLDTWKIHSRRCTTKGQAPASSQVWILSLTRKMNVEYYSLKGRERRMQQVVGTPWNSLTIASDKVWKERPYQLPYANARLTPELVTF